MPKLRREPRVTVGYELSRDCANEDRSTALCRDLIEYSSKMHHLAEPVHEHKNTIILVSVFGGTEDVVRGNGLPALCRDR